MFFNDKFIKNLEENPIRGIVEACEMSLSHMNTLGDNNQGWNKAEHDFLWEAASFIRLAMESNNISIALNFPEVTSSIQQNCVQINDYINKVLNAFKEYALQLQIESFSNIYKTAFKNSFAYEFSQGDLDRIQILVNELRVQISQNSSLADDHKERLLKRLEKLQSELHKRVSDLDRFWGLIGDAGVVLGKLGTDAKPIVDRVKEVAEIVWKTQARTEELPSDLSNPMLEDKRFKST